jgi:hypothetical protein
MRWVLLLAFLGCGTSSSAPTDAGAADAAPVDAAPPPDDAGHEASGTTRFCDSVKATFCDDFDKGDLGSTWDFFQQTPPGVGVLDEANFKSAPAAFGVRTKKCAQGDVGTILLRKTIAGGASHVVLAFDVNADVGQASGTLAIATLDLSTSHLLTLYLRDDDPNTPGPTLTEVAPGVSTAIRNPFTKLPAAGAWHNVTLDVDAANGTAALLIDTVNVLSATIAKAPVDSPTIRVGVLVTGPAQPYTFDFDNVALTVTP